MLHTENCENCLFWLRWRGIKDIKQVWGNCRRTAGQVVMVGNDLKTKQPLKHQEDWCGDWEQK